MINTDDEFDVQAKWCGHEGEEEITWEPLDNLVEDVPTFIAKYVCDEMHHQLTDTHQKIVCAAKKHD